MNGEVIGGFPRLMRWKEDIARRPAMARAHPEGKAINAPSQTSAEALHRILFGQTAAVVSR